MRGTINIYLIWYGDWSNNDYNRAIRDIVVDFMNGIGNTEWYRLNTEYYDQYGSISGNLRFYSTMVGYGLTQYPHGQTLDVNGVMQVVRDNIQSNQFPFDSSGLYIVLTSKDVGVTAGDSGTFCSATRGFCGWHTYTSLNLNGQSKNLRFAWIGDPSRCGGGCDVQRTSPNGNWAADSMVSTIGHEIVEAATNPEFTAWYDAQGEENADKCSWTYGNTLHLSNGAAYNMEFGGRKWLIQQVWKKNGGCAMSLTGGNNPLVPTSREPSTTEPSTTAESTQEITSAGENSQEATSFDETLISQEGTSVNEVSPNNITVVDDVQNVKDVQNSAYHVGIIVTMWLLCVF